jgi:hypothetical protein
MSYPKVIFGPFSTLNSGKGRVMRVEFQTNGDWRKTQEGEGELDRVGSMLINSFDKLHLPEKSAVQFENPNWMYLTIPCAEKQVAGWMEILKKRIPELTNAVYNSIGVSPNR